MGLFDLFRGGSGRAPGTYRVRKEGGILSSIVGAFIGVLLLVIGGPLAAWFAESQHRAEDFATAVQVEADDVQDGYVVVQATPEVNEFVICPEPNTGVDQTDEELSDEELVVDSLPPTDCLFVEEKMEEYTYEVKEHEGSLEPNQIEIRYIEEVCDSDGTNCEPVYEVEEYDWEEIDSSEEYAEFALGSYTVTADGTSNFIGEVTFEEYDVSGIDYVDGYDLGDIRYTYTYMPADQEILVAGHSNGGVITGTNDGEPFVVSNRNYEATVADLQAQDAAAKWGLRILSFFLMVFGAIMVVGPLTMLTNVFRVVPFIGKRADKGVDFVIQFFAAVIGMVLWVIVYGAVLVLKNIWLILIVFGIIGVIVLVLLKRGGKDDDQSGTPSGTPSSPAGGMPASAAPQMQQPTAQPMQQPAEAPQVKTMNELGMNQPAQPAQPQATPTQPQQPPQQ